MVDTRPKAYEKARKRAEELRAQRDALQENSPVQTGKPPGAGFESERQRAKNALRDELDTYDGTGVHKIIASAERMFHRLPQGRHPVPRWFLGRPRLPDG